jgi:hypothetical protein
MQGKLKYTNNPNFIFYTPIAPLARHRLINVFFTHFPLHARLIVEFCFFEKNLLLKSCILFSITFSYFQFLYYYFSPFYFFVFPEHVLGPRHSAYSA